MKLRVTCPQCGHEVVGDVLTTVRGERFMVCKEELHPTFPADFRGRRYFCNTYIAITEKAIPVVTEPLAS